MVNIRRIESDLRESTYLLRIGSKLTSNQYCISLIAGRIKGLALQNSNLAEALDRLLPKLMSGEVEA